MEFQGQYRPVGDVKESQPGTLEHWLTERYCLYAINKQGILHRCEVHHAPWPLQRGEVIIETNTMFTPAGIAVGSAEPLVHFAKRLDVVVWPCQPVSSYIDPSFAAALSG